MKKLSSMLPTFSPEITAEMEARSKAWEAEQVRYKVQKRIRESGIPKAFLNAKFEGDIPTDNLLLQGKVGRGKTHYACSLLMELAKSKTVRFATMMDVLRDIRSCYNGIESESQVMSRYRNVGTLVIDDFGKEKPTDWALSMIFDILNYRLNAEKQTILTTQYSGKELIERLASEGELDTAKAILSRISTYTRIPFEGKDRRLP